VSEARSTRVRAANRLSAIKVSKLKEPGLYEDGAGLRLVITEQGIKRWTLRVTINGRRVERGLGVMPTVGLDEARRKAEVFRRAAQEGRDARKEEKEGRRTAGVTFKDAFKQFFDVRRQQLKNAKHIQQWENTMRDFVFPVIGNRPVAEVTPAEVLKVLQPIWFAKPETASRVLQRLSAVFDSAILRQTRERSNPCIGVTRELGTDHRKVTHHPALPWAQVPSFVQGLHKGPATLTTKLLFEFLIHTVARSEQAREALWQEFDLERRTWTIPALDPVTKRRMKGGKPHVVPLSDRVMEILAQARGLHDGDLVFPGQKGQSLSDNTLSKLMRDAKIPGTPHGFRSSFKDWAAETGVRDEVSEAALAHKDRNKVRAAYRRTRFLDERVGVMRAWSKFVTCPDPQDGLEFKGAGF
jgi:integrase